MTDWGAGQYERTAAVLAPAAQGAVSVLAPSAGERVLDVACGTGNAALLVAAAGAEVVGIDLAERLVEVAAERADGAGLSERRDVRRGSTCSEKRWAHRRASTTGQDRTKSSRCLIRTPFISLNTRS